jgi:hypothetical protein
MSFQLLMLSAMYENGGNTTHRFLDGHPEMYVYPFESQVGTHLVHDHFTSMFPVKYRWPVFALEATPQQDFKAIIDEECKVRARTPHVSKFRHMEFDLNDNERCDIYVKEINDSGRSRPNNMAAFFKATFSAWKNYAKTGREKCYVGYCPIIVIDAEKIIQDFSSASVLHIVRNPWSAYADTKKRPVPLDLRKYITAWVNNQYHALTFQKLYPNRVFILRLEDILEDPPKVLGDFCPKIGLNSSDMLSQPTWNGELLKEVYPWGTIRHASPEANRKTASELSDDERDLIRTWAGPYLDIFKYTDFVRTK